MTTDKGSIVFDVRFLLEASKRLHGYYLYRWFARYLGLIVENMRRLMDHGAIGPDARPSARTDYGLLFDINALHLEAMTDIVGAYFYILSSHKKANYYLMQENETRRVLYLRGFDYEGAVASGDGLAAGFASMYTTQFNWKLGEHLADGFHVFMPLSPQDLYWDTADAYSYFYGDFESIIHLCSEPIRAFYLNANHWQEDIAQLFDRMDYFVVYVSSVTESVLWEIDLLQRKQRAQHATLIFDEEAIANKELQASLQQFVGEEYPDDVRWAKSMEGAPGLSAEVLREQLSKQFLVVSPDEFFEHIDEHRNRITESRAPVGPAAREAPLDFRFYPALDVGGLQEVRDFDQVLDSAIRQMVSSRTITNLPWFLNQVQLKIFTTLMLGHHDETGWALAVYAAVTDVVPKRLLSKAGRSVPMTKRKRSEIRDRLEQHFEMAEHFSHTLLSYGQSHQFGDYRALAEEVYEETFAAASEAVEDFFDKACFEQRTAVYGLPSSPGKGSLGALVGPSRTIRALVSRFLGSGRDR